MAGDILKIYILQGYVYQKNFKLTTTAEKEIYTRPVSWKKVCDTEKKIFMHVYISHATRKIIPNT